MKSINKRVLSMMLVLVTVLAMLPMAVFAASNTIYVQPNENWLQANARFAAYFFEGSENTWLDCTDAGNGLYKVEVPAGYTNVIFCRMNPGTTANSWDTKWNQTADLTVPTDNKVVYVVDGWDKGNGQWIVVGGEPEEIEVIYYIRGEMNDWGAVDAMTNNGDGTYTLSMDLAAGTYQYKAGDAGWGNSVPAGTDNLTLTLSQDGKVTFVLDINAGTLTASGKYVVEPDPVVYDYYLAGDEGLTGSNWDPSANKMTDKGNGLYEITFSNVAAGNYEFKVATGSWETPAYGVDGNNCTVAVAAPSNVTITFNKETLEITASVADPCADGCDEFNKKVTYPTLTTNGYTTLTCKLCGKTRVENYTFPDVPNSFWSYKAVEFAVAKGYFSGYKSGNFGPTDNITRQDFVVVLARIAKVDLKKYSGRTGFPDVKAGDYYEAAVKWASSNKIVNGYNNGNFGVGDQITREQMVTILYNYAKKCGYDVSVPESAKTKLNAYTDAGKITGYAKPAVIWALYKGVISGMTATTIAPQNPASRGQAATILMNISTKNIMPI